MTLACNLGQGVPRTRDLTTSEQIWQASTSHARKPSAYPDATSERNTRCCLHFVLCGEKGFRDKIFRHQPYFSGAYTPTYFVGAYRLILPSH